MRLQICLLAIATAISSTVGAVSAGKPVYIGQKTKGRLSFDQVDHQPFDRLLQRYVDTDGYVDYSRWNSSREDRTALQRYIASLSVASPATRATREGKLAFWINAYNAVTLEGILREYPTTSIRNHTAKLVGYNIWKDLQLYVDGQAWSLDAMEHQVLRKMNEPRIHFVIVCASVGCPRLLNRAFDRNEIERQLDLNARDFFSRRQNFQYDPGTQTARLSSILQWFASDFGADQTAQMRTISQWVPKPVRSAVASGRIRVSFNDYNWGLNDQKLRGAAGHR